ncbi:hypothetical protein RFI_37496, partial [Reticulomyxa filosa]
GNSELCSNLEILFLNVHKQFKKYNDDYLFEYHHALFNLIIMCEYCHLIYRIQLDTITRKKRIDQGLTALTANKTFSKNNFKHTIIEIIVVIFLFQHFTKKKMEMTKEMLSDQRDPKVSERLIANKDLNQLFNHFLKNNSIRKKVSFRSSSLLNDHIILSSYKRENNFFLFLCYHCFQLILFRNVEKIAIYHFQSYLGRYFIIITMFFFVVMKLRIMGKKNVQKKKGSKKIIERAFQNTSTNMDSFFNRVVQNKDGKKSEHLHNGNYKLILNLNESNISIVNTNIDEMTEKKEDMCDSKSQVGSE